MRIPRLILAFAEANTHTHTRPLPCMDLAASPALSRNVASILGHTQQQLTRGYVMYGEQASMIEGCPPRWASVCGMRMGDRDRVKGSIRYLIKRSVPK